MATWMLILVVALGALGVALLLAVSFGRASGNADSEEEQLLAERRHALQEASQRPGATVSRDDDDEDDDVEVLTSR